MPRRRGQSCGSGRAHGVDDRKRDSRNRSRSRSRSEEIPGNLVLVRYVEEAAERLKKCLLSWERDRTGNPSGNSTGNSGTDPGTVPVGGMGWLPDQRAPPGALLGSAPHATEAKRTGAPGGPTRATSLAQTTSAGSSTSSLISAVSAPEFTSAATSASRPHLSGAAPGRWSIGGYQRPSGPCRHPGRRSSSTPRRYARASLQRDERPRAPSLDRRLARLSPRGVLTPFDRPITITEPRVVTDLQPRCVTGAPRPRPQTGPGRVNALTPGDVGGRARTPALAALGWAREDPRQPAGQPNGNSTGTGTTTGPVSGM